MSACLWMSCKYLLPYSIISDLTEWKFALTKMLVRCSAWSLVTKSHRPDRHRALTRVMLICISILTIIGSDNGLSSSQHQAIIGTNAGILLLGPLETIFSKILIKIHIPSLKKMHLKMSAGKCQPSDMR